MGNMFSKQASKKITKTWKTKENLLTAYLVSLGLNTPAQLTPTEVEGGFGGTVIIHAASEIPSSRELRELNETTLTESGVDPSIAQFIMNYVNPQAYFAIGQDIVLKCLAERNCSVFGRSNITYNLTLQQPDRVECEIVTEQFELINTSVASRLLTSPTPLITYKTKFIIETIARNEVDYVVPVSKNRTENGTENDLGNGPSVGAKLIAYEVSLAGEALSKVPGLEDAIAIPQPFAQTAISQINQATLPAPIAATHASKLKKIMWGALFVLAVGAALATATFCAPAVAAFLGLATLPVVIKCLAIAAYSVGISGGTLGAAVAANWIYKQCQSKPVKPVVTEDDASLAGSDISFHSVGSSSEQHLAIN